MDIDFGESQDQAAGFDSQHATVPSPPFNADEQAGELYADVETSLLLLNNRYLFDNQGYDSFRGELQVKFRNHLQTYINPFTNTIDEAQRKLS